MDDIPAADLRAESLVGVGREGPSGGFYIILRSPVGRSVYLGPYANRDVAKLEAAQVRRFVAAVILEARAAEPRGQAIGDQVAWNESNTVIPACELLRQLQPNG